LEGLKPILPILSKGTSFYYILYFPIQLWLLFGGGPNYFSLVGPGGDRNYWPVSRVSLGDSVHFNSTIREFPGFYFPRDPIGFGASTGAFPEKPFPWGKHILGSIGGPNPFPGNLGRGPGGPTFPFLSFKGVRL